MAEAGEGEGEGDEDRAVLQRQASAPAGPAEAEAGQPSYPVANGEGPQALSSLQASKSKRHGQAKNPQGMPSVGSVGGPPLGRLTGKSSGISTSASGRSAAGHAVELEGEGYSWRSTIPATAACTACLFVQKAVQQG